MSNQIVAEKEEEKQIQGYNIDGFITKRKEFIEKVNDIMLEGNDYHVIKDKKSMAKGGAEKIASIFNWQASFKRDAESLEMLGNPAGLVALTCTLTHSGNFVGEGRGAASLAKNANDANKTLKMAQKSAFIDAVIRASGLSDFYTQDLEDMNPRDIGEYKPEPSTSNFAYRDSKPSFSKPASDKQKDYMHSLRTEKNLSDADLIKLSKISGLVLKKEISSADISDWIKFLNENSKEDLEKMLGKTLDTMNAFRDDSQQELPVIQVDMSVNPEDVENL